HYVNANFYTRRRMVLLRGLLELTGIDPERFKLDWVSASEGRRYSSLVTDFTEKLRELGMKKEWGVRDRKSRIRHTVKPGIPT
ncbi:hydrogenase iron-sulfur subunit, partial [candidate division TA06 bacterium]